MALDVSSKMKLKKYQRKYEKSIEEYRKSIEKLLNELVPKINIPLAVVGFLIVVSGITPVFIILVNATIINQPLTAFSIITCFFCYMISFSGYMLVHRSTERDWL